MSSHNALIGGSVLHACSPGFSRSVPSRSVALFAAIARCLRSDSNISRAGNRTQVHHAPPNVHLRAPMCSYVHLRAQNKILQKMVHKPHTTAHLLGAPASCRQLIARSQSDPCLPAIASQRRPVRPIQTSSDLFLLCASLRPHVPKSVSIRVKKFCVLCDLCG